MVSPLYIAEISPPERRGLLVSLNQLTIVLGIVVAFFSNYLLIGVGEDNWRWMFGVEAVPALVFFAALFLVPESPRWLVRQGAIPEATSVLGKLRGVIDVRDEIEAIKEVLAGEHSGKLADLVAPALRRVLIVGMGLAVLQQIVGINVVMYALTGNYKSDQVHAPAVLERLGQ